MGIVTATVQRRSIISFMCNILVMINSQNDAFHGIANSECKRMGKWIGVEIIAVRPFDIPLPGGYYVKDD